MEVPQVAACEGRASRAGLDEAHVCRAGLDHHTLKDLLSERMSQTRRLQSSLTMQAANGLNDRRDDRVLQQSRSTRHYCPRQRDDGPLIAAI